MGMGHASCSGWTIGEDKIKKYAKKEWNDFIKAIKNSSISMEEFAQELAYGKGYSDTLDEKHFEKCNTQYHKLCDAFQLYTNLTLNINYHNISAEGDRYDDVDGVFWELGNVTKLTPSAKKMEKDIRYSRWVIYG